MNETLKTNLREISLEYLKNKNHVNIFWNNGNGWILVCQSSGKHFISDIEVLKLENGNVGKYKVTDSQVMVVL